MNISEIRTKIKTNIPQKNIHVSSSSSFGFCIKHRKIDQKTHHSRPLKFLEVTFFSLWNEGDPQSEIIHWQRHLRSSFHRWKLSFHLLLAEKSKVWFFFSFFDNFMFNSESSLLILYTFVRNVAWRNLLLSLYICWLPLCIKAVIWRDIDFSLLFICYFGFQIVRLFVFLFVSVHRFW